MSATRQDSSKKGSSEALKMLAKYPDRLPVICLKAPDFGMGAEEFSGRLGTFAALPERKKFLVPNSMVVQGLKDTIRSHIKDTTHAAVDIDLIKLSASGTLLGDDETLKDTYNKHKADDCFLYIHFNVGSTSADAAGQAATPSGGQSPSAAEQPGKDIQQKPVKDVGKEARKLLARHPNNIPVICSKVSGSDAPDIPKSKFLVPCAMSCRELETVVLDNINKGVQQQEPPVHKPLVAVSLAVGDKVIEGEANMKQVYEQNKSPDGFLYLVYDSKQLPGFIGASSSTEKVEAETSQAKVDGEMEASTSAMQSATSAKDEEKQPPLQVESTGSQKDDGEEPLPPEEEPAAETGGTPSPQGVSGPGTSSSGTISIHLPDNDVTSAQGLVTECEMSRERVASAFSSTASTPARSRSEQEAGQIGLVTEYESDWLAASSSAQAPSSQGERRTVSRPTSALPEKAAASAGTEASSLLELHPGRIPVLCTKGRPDVPDIGRTKYLVPGTMLCSEFKYLIHRQLRDTRGGDIGIYETIYLFVENVSPKTGMPMSELYARYKKDDGYLHITYSLENTLGCM